MVAVPVGHDWQRIDLSLKGAFIAKVLDMVVERQITVRRWIVHSDYGASLDRTRRPASSDLCRRVGASRPRQRISSTCSGGRPSRAALPVTTIGRSIKIGLATMAAISASSVRLSSAKPSFLVRRFGAPHQRARCEPQHAQQLFQSRGCRRLLQILDDLRRLPALGQQFQCRPRLRTTRIVVDRQIACHGSDSPLSRRRAQRRTRRRWRWRT